MNKATNKVSCLVVLTLMLASLAGAAWSWGTTAHTLITEHAIDMLPPEMKPFYSANSRYIVAFAMLPDDWRETYKKETGNHHYIDLDLLDQPPFSKVSVPRDKAEKTFGREQLEKAGLLPWIIEERFNKLVEAMRKKNREEIVIQSSLLAHFVADGHVPFHNTKDYDGKKPEQKGIHFRWEENLISLKLKPEMIKPSKPMRVKKILSDTFNYCIETFGYVDAICEADDSAREADSGHSYKYYKILWDKTGKIAVKCIKNSAEAVAGTWIAAWEEAGKPDLGDKVVPFFWGH